MRKARWPEDDSDCNRLIEVAPSMLTALKALVEDYEGAYGGEDEPGALVLAKAVIAKAEGRAS